MKKVFLLTSAVGLFAMMQPAQAQPADILLGTTASASHGSWWARLGDPALAMLVERALKDSPDIEQAAARLDRARAAARATRAALLPNVAANAGAAAIRQSLEDPQIRPFAGIPGFPRDVERYQGGVTASWEIDLFGSKPRRRAARAGVAAADADLAAARIVVAAETATAWINVRELQARLRLAEARVTTLEQQSTAIKLRLAAGTTARLDVDRLEGEVQGAAAAVPVLKILLASEIARLGVLVGDAETAQMASALPFASAQLLPPSLQGMEVTIARRPDVISAQQRLIAADAGVSVAKAQRLPSLSLTGLIATIAAGPAALFSAAATSAQAGGMIRLPLLDFGRIDADIADACGAQRGALANYRQALLEAAADVEVAAIATANRKAEAERQQAAAAALGGAEAAATATWEAGALDLTALLDTVRSSISAQENAVTAQAASTRAIVSLLRATAGSETSSEVGMITRAGDQSDL